MLALRAGRTQYRLRYSDARVPSPRCRDFICSVGMDVISARIRKHCSGIQPVPPIRGALGVAMWLVRWSTPLLLPPSCLLTLMCVS